MDLPKNIRAHAFIASLKKFHQASMLGSEIILIRSALQEDRCTFRYYLTAETSANLVNRKD